MTSTSSGQFEAKLYHMIFEEEFARFKGHFGPINSITFDPTGDIGKYKIISFDKKADLKCKNSKFSFKIQK